MSATLSRFFLLLALLFSASSTLFASQDQEETFRLDSGNRAYIGIGVAIVEFDTTIKFTDKPSGISIFVDGEGTLGLPDIDSVNTIYGGVGFGEKHSLHAGYFSVKRENIISFSTQTLDELVLVNADATLRDETRFMNLDYGYNLFSDYRSSVDLLVGIFVLDLKYTLEANGEYEINGVRESGNYFQEAKAIAPVPNLGLYFDYAFTPKWSVGARFSMIAGSYQDITARAIKTTLRAKYSITRSFHADIGVSYFDADVTIDNEDTIAEVGYGYDGLYAGVHWEF